MLQARKLDSPWCVWRAFGVRFGVRLSKHGWQGTAQRMRTRLRKCGHETRNSEQMENTPQITGQRGRQERRQAGKRAGYQAGYQAALPPAHQPAKNPAKNPAKKPGTLNLSLILNEKTADSRLSRAAHPRSCERILSKSITITITITIQLYNYINS